MNSNKHYFYTSVWFKYVPILRIVIKKSSTQEQVFAFNRIDFERAGYARKSGYRFTVSFNNNRTDLIFAGNELIQTFVSVLQEDEVISQLLSTNNYTFVFSSKFILHIKNNGPSIPADVPEEASSGE
ncbi:MAG: hypothetical protein ABJB05_04220 [Parafilimonas sp.]